ncbi:hypothetical protein PGTUg99_012805 [Puccinia graminis f. sp. tritici]|uniref:Uncharacterized protein n=1 Tax=Puccinia graminis f. sp. tritici TaxID=56615 RepID=A0A5B0RBN0_PUCGR|nr:hypothetical protein PGTUg99_012805 [Puccinia graminis f. sp. tritici]
MSKDESAAAAAQEMPHTIGQSVNLHRLKAENSLAGQWPVSACLSASLRQTAADKCQSAVHTPSSRLDCDFEVCTTTGYRHQNDLTLSISRSDRNNTNNNKDGLDNWSYMKVERANIPTARVIFFSLAGHAEHHQMTWASWTGKETSP